MHLHTEFYLFLSLQEVRDKFACKNTCQQLLNDRKKCSFPVLGSLTLFCELTWWIHTTANKRVPFLKGRVKSILLSPTFCGRAEKQSKGAVTMWPPNDGWKWGEAPSGVTSKSCRCARQEAAGPFPSYRSQDQCCSQWLWAQACSDGLREVHSPWISHRPQRKLQVIRPINYR